MLPRICMDEGQHKVTKGSDTGIIHVLVVDDEPIIRDLLRAMLVGMKTKVDVAENGVDAQKKVLSGSYELVITDINMPEMDGIALLKWLKEKKPEIETVVMTGYDITEEMLETIGNNAMEYFEKPPEPKKIKTALHHCRERLHFQ